MNVLLISINYSPEQTGFAPHTSALCEYLTDCGHFVRVLTGFPFAPHWLRWPAYRGMFFSRENIGGVDVLRLTHFIPRSPGQALHRLLMEGTFSIFACLAGTLSSPRAWDIVVYVGAQPSLAMAARMIARFHRIPYVVKITDLAAQAAADVGMINATWLKKLLNRFEHSAYRCASGAIVLCAGFRDILVANRYPSDRIRIIPDSVDLEQIHPVSSSNDFRAAHGIAQADFVVLYSGSMGGKQGLTNVVEAAHLLRDICPSVKWILVGEGQLRSKLKTLIDQLGLGEQVKLLQLQPQAQMSKMFSSADVLLLNQLKQFKDTVIPSKLLTYMAAGRAVVAAVNPKSQAAHLLRQSEGAVMVEPEDPAALAAAIRKLQVDPYALQGMGRLNRQFAETHFDRRNIVARQERFLHDVVNKGTTRRRTALGGVAQT